MKRLWLIGLVALLLLAGCGTTATTTALPADQKTFADQVDAMSENLLTALNNHDYAAFSRDMDEQMKATTGEAQFEELYNLIITTKLGKYVSRQVVRVDTQEQLRAVTYDARFEQEEHVNVRVVYNLAGEQPLVGGLWFDSAKLRQQ